MSWYKADKPQACITATRYASWYKADKPQVRNFFNA
jgi:hypothetical protein